MDATPFRQWYEAHVRYISSLSMRQNSEGDNSQFPQYAQPVSKKGGKKDVAPEGEEEKKQPNHVVRKFEERKKGKAP